MGESGKSALTGWIPASKDYIDMLQEIKSCHGVDDVMIEVEVEFSFEDLGNGQSRPTVCSFSIVGDEAIIKGFQKEWSHRRVTDGSINNLLIRDC